jgi:hypothetical protein
MKTGLLAFSCVIYLSAGPACYAPDYTQVIYKCDRGKCPEDYYCISDGYCTKKVDTCAVGGVQISDTATVCIGRSNPADPNTICAAGTTSGKCDAQTTSRELCKNVGNCSYCCR